MHNRLHTDKASRLVQFVEPELETLVRNMLDLQKNCTFLVWMCS